MSTTHGVIRVIGLGPAGVDLLAASTIEAIAGCEQRYARTDRHPAITALGAHRSFDDIYESAETMAEVYETIVETLVAEATEHGEILYAVPGSPAVAEHTVELLRTRSDVVIDVVPALSFVDLTWIRLGVDPISAGVRIVDGQQFTTEAAGERGPLLVSQCDTKTVLSDIKLSVDDSPAEPVVVLQRLGLPTERIFEVSWDDLDRSFEPDHLTSLYIPQLASPVGAELLRFAELVRTLRRECPWDRKQTHKTLGRYLLEESYEVLEAIDLVDDETGEGYVDLEEELGDLFFQVYLHSAIAAEHGRFDLADVARGIHDKLYARHPHVFGDAHADTADEVVGNWEQLKRSEKGRASIMEGIPKALPALLYTLKVQKKAATQGFGFDSVEGSFGDVDDELAEAREDPSAHEVGDLLFAAVGVARHLDLDPEEALRHASDRFRERFMLVESLAETRRLDLATASGKTRDALWAEAKATLAG